MTTYTWRGGIGDWQTAANWTPGGGPPSAAEDDIAQADGVATITGVGSADEFQTTNLSGLVTLDGDFNLGTIFNGDSMALAGTIASDFLETFVTLAITGTVSVVGDLDDPDQGILQGNGAVVIDNGGSVTASSYTMNYIPGSLVPPPPNASSLLIDGDENGASLDIKTVATVDTVTNEIVGGFGILTAGTVDVVNGGTLSVTYLSIETPDGTIIVDNSTMQVLQTSTDPDGVAGINIDGGKLEIQNDGSLFGTFLYQGGDDDSSFIVSGASATFTAPDDTINGIEEHDGGIYFQNNASVDATQVHLAEALDINDEIGPFLSIDDSTLTITGTATVPGLSFSGIWLADGATDIADSSQVTTPMLELDSPAVADPEEDIGNDVTIESGSTVTVANSVILGVTDDSSVVLTVTGAGTQLLWGDQLDVADGSGGGGTGAAGDLHIKDGASVTVGDDPDATGLLAVGGNAGDTGDVEVLGDGSTLSANDAIVGDSGNGTLFASEGGTIDISGTLDIGLNDGGVGTVRLASADGSGTLTVGTLDIGDYGDGTLYLSSGDGLNSGTLTVADDAFAGVFDGGSGTIFSSGGMISIGGDFTVGDDGSGFVNLDSTDLDITGDLFIGDGGTAAYLGLMDVDLTLGGTLNVGEEGPGTLDWGSSLGEQETTLDTVVIGDQSDGDGTFVLHDPTTSLTIGTLAVGDEGSGTFDIFNGATVEVTDEAGIALEDNSAGAIVLQAGTNDLGDDYPNGGSSIVFDQDLDVGDGGTGLLIVGDTENDGDGAAAKVNGDLVIGDKVDALGTVEVGGNYVDQDGTTVASLLTVGGNIFVGVDATGTLDPITGTFDPGGVLNVTNGGTVDATEDGSGFVVVAQDTDSTGEIDVSYGGLLNANDLTIGDGGDGVLSINYGQVVVSGDIVVGNSQDSTGTIDIDGDALLQSDGSMIIGGGATAYVNDGTIEYPAMLDATGGATVENTGTGDDLFAVGYDPGSLGEAIIDGSTIDVNAATIGEDGSGVLEIINGSTATFNDDLILGDGTASFGGMDVDDSDVDFYGTLVVGEAATGATIGGTFIPGGLLTIEDGSTVLDQDFNGIDIADESGSTGAMIVDDSDVEPTFITIGDGGDGTLTIRNDGSLFVDADSDVEIGTDADSSGTVTVDGGMLGYGSELDVAIGGTGILNIMNGGTVGPDMDADDTDVTIADDATSKGTVTVDNSLLITDDIIVGNTGTAVMTVENGGTVDTAGDAVIAALGSVLGGPDGNGTGTVDLIGLGGTIDDTLWKIDGQLSVGELGSGTVDVNDGATLTVGDEFDVGNSSEVVGSTGNGLVSAFGTNSLIKADDDMYIGGDGRGTVALAGNAVLQAGGDVTMGDGINSAGSLMISGATFVSTGGDVTIGEQGAGFVQIAYGGDFNAGSSDVILGDSDLGNGTLNLVPIGTGNPTAETGDLTVGEKGTGSLSVTGNGLVTTNGDAVIGDTGNGDVVINGISATGTFAPATWNIDGDLSIGGLTTAGGGVGTVAVSNNGVIHVAGEVVMWDHGTLLNNGTTRGLIEIGGTTLTSGTQIVIDAAIAATSTTTAVAQGTLSGGGTILSNILDNGLIDLTNGQSLVIFGSIVGFGTLLLDGTAVMQVNGAIASTVSIDFDSGAGQTDVLELTNPLEVQGTIYNLGSSDGIDLLGVKSAGSSFNIVNDVLTVINGGSTVAALALGGTTYSASAFSLTEDGSGNAEVVFENPVPPPAAPALVMPAELPAYPLSFQEYLTGTSGIYVNDPNAPVNSTYTLTLNDQTGTLFVLYGSDTTQTDTAGSDPIKFIGSLAEINADLEHLIYADGGSAFAQEAAPPDTITASLVRGDGVTVTAATGFNPPVSDASIVYSGPTTVALGQAISLSFTPSDPMASYAGEDLFGANVNTDSNSRLEAPFNGYLLALNQFSAQGGVTAYYLNDESTSLANLASDLGGGNLLFVPTNTGTVPIDGSFYEYANDELGDQIANFTVNITVTAATRTKGVTDDWTGAVSAVLITAGNWSQNFAPGTIDTAVFRPIGGVPVITTTGGGVAGAWDIDTSTNFAGVIDATGAAGGTAFDVDQGATARFLDGSGLFAASLFDGSIDGEAIAAVRGNSIIVGDTAPSVLIMSNADLVTGETTIGNDSSAGGSYMTLTNVFWQDDGNTATGNPGDVLVGNNGYGVLTLLNTQVDNVEATNYQAAGYGQIQIGQDNPGAAGSGGLGVFIDSNIRESVQVGYYGPGELVMGGGSIGNAINIQFVSLALHGGRVDWGGGATLYITNGLAGSDPATIDGGSVVSGDDWTISNEGSGVQLTNDGTLEAAAGGPSSIDGIGVGGSGTLLIDAGATLDVNYNSEAETTISSGQTVIFAPEFNGAGGLLSLEEPGNFHGTIAAFADGDRIAVPAGDSGASVVSATYSAGSNTTAVGFALTEDGGIPFGGTIDFEGSLSVGNFAIDPVGPAGYSTFEYVETGVSFQPPIISAPSDIAATDGVANLMPGLGLSDEDAERNNLKVQVTLTPVSGNAGIFSAPAAAGVTILGDDTEIITVSGALAAVQAELAKIGFTPTDGFDEYIQVTASDGKSQASPVTFLAHNSASASSEYTGTDNYIYTGPANGSFDNVGSWQDESGTVYPSGPGIADSATIVSDPFTGGEDVIGGIGVAGQLLTEGLVVLTGSLTLAGLPLAGIGTDMESGPEFAGALEAGAGNLILGSGSELDLDGDLIVTGTVDDIADNPWSIGGNIHINGGTLILGGLGALTVTGTVEAAGGEMDVLGNETVAAGASPIVTSAAALIGMGAGTAVVNIGNVGPVQAWAIAGALVAGASGDAEVTIGSSGIGSSSPAASAATVTVARSAGVTASLSVWAGSTLAVAANLTVGDAGKGTLDVTNGDASDQNDGGGAVMVGSTASPGELDIGAAASGVGIVDISTAGDITVDGSAYLGGTSAGASGGTGTVEVSGEGFLPSFGALFDVTGDFTEYSGTMLLREGTAGMGGLIIESGATLSGDGFVNGPGVETGNLTNPTIINTSAPLTTIVDDGLIDANANPANGAAVLSLYGSVSGTGTLDIEAGATLDIEGSVASSLHMMFDGPGGELILSQPGNFAPVIDGFQTGDEIRMAGVAPGTVAYNTSSGLLTDTVGGTVYSFVFDPPAGSFAAVTDTHDGTLLELTAGPVISTPATVTVGVNQPGTIADVSLAGTSTETGDTFTVTLSDTNGKLSASGTGISGSDSKTLTITGSVSSINSALLTLSDTDAITPSDTITLSATDNTQTISASPQTIAVTVNGPPVIGVPGAQVIEADAAYDINGIALSESGDTGNETFTAVLTDTTGSLAVIANGSSVTGQNSTGLTVVGSLADVNQALNSLTDDEPSAGSDPITINASDGFGNVAQTTTLQVTANSQPEISAPTTLLMGVGILTDVTGVTVNETGNTSGIEFTVTLENANGQLTVDESDGVYVVGSPAEFYNGYVHPADADLTLIGSLLQIQDALKTLTDKAVVDGPDTIAITAIDDNGGTATPAGTISVSVAGDPVIAVPAPVTLGVGQPAFVSGIVLSEAYAAVGETFTVTLTDTSGLLSATAAGGATVGGVGTKTLTVGGLLSDVNNTLTSLTDSDGITASDTIVANASDGYGNIAGTQTVAVTVNSGPEISAPSGTTIAQSVLTPITGISLTETGDISNETFTVTVSDTYGLLSTSNAGAAVVNGTDSTALTISGGLSDVNTALQNLDDTDGTAAPDTIELNAKDSFGNTDGPVPIGVTIASSGPQLSGVIALTAATAGTPLPDTTEIASFTDTNLTDISGAFDATISWGDGTPATEATVTGSNGSFTVAGGHTYSAPGDDTLSVTIDDTSNDAQLPLSGTVDVSDGNVLIGQGLTFSPNTGEPFSGTVANFTDADTITPASDFSATIDWGDRSSPASGVVSGSDGSFSVTGDHTYASSGDDPVTVTLIENAPGTASATAGSTADVTPQLAGEVTLSAATQDTPLSGSTEVASFTDTNLADTSGTFSAEIDWGDGSPAQAGTVIGSDGSFVVEAGHTYGTPGDDTLGVTITDTANNAQLPLSGTVDVADGNAFVGQGVTLATTAGLTFSGTVASFTDSDTITSASDLTASIDWGDGTAATSGIVSGSDGSFTVSGTHDYTTQGVDTVTVTLSDNAPGTASGIATGTADIGQTFILTKGVDIVSGGPGDNVIIAGSNTLSAGDEIDGGAGGANVLDLTTAGTFNLKLPSALTDVQVVNAQEGQAAYSNGGETFTATNQIVTLRSGLNVTVDVSAATVNPENPKPATITIIGANDASVIDLAGGNDVVTVGGAAETVHGGTGDDQIQVTAATIGATIDGGSGQSTLDVLGGGSVTMGPSVTDISNVVLASTPGAMSFIANGISGLLVDDASSGADLVTAGGSHQTLTGGAGHETFDGFGGGSTNFQDTAAAINGDTINNFLAGGDAIDITNLNFNAPEFSFNPVQNGSSVTLNITDGTHGAALTLNGSFNVADFRVGPDSGSGTSISYQAPRG